ncbi:TPA_asm: hypothetical protein GYX24_15330 [Listeria monocytogenes]|nr:hypothetical protein [Listeria monocytogenes]HAB7575664.1 hypothetical protein [Listeria monocytogenes]HAB9981332.1 hypothetical protein [Listeria monocytogenes]HAC0145401.1 hypothetical protein [Listeria monocytogenes]HAC0151322.1 hypothetical protein [Listeria monocytogenes]
MKAENKLKRNEIIKQIGGAEDANDFAEIVRLGADLMALEESEETELKSRNKIELTVNEYLKYKENFTDLEIAEICDVHYKTVYLFKKRHGLVGLLEPFRNTAVENPLIVDDYWNDGFRH